MYNYHLQEVDELFEGNIDAARNLTILQKRHVEDFANKTVSVVFVTIFSSRV